MHGTVGAEPGVRLPDVLTSVSSLYFHSIWRLLILFPGLFAISLSLGHSFVLVFHFLHVHVLFHSSFILEHSSHASNSVSLHGTSLFFCAVSIRLIAVFTVLLITPFLLSLGVFLHAGLVYYREVSARLITYINLLLQIVWRLKHGWACPNRVCQSAIWCVS